MSAGPRKQRSGSKRKQVDACHSEAISNAGATSQEAVAADNSKHQGEQPLAAAAAAAIPRKSKREKTFSPQATIRANANGSAAVNDASSTAGVRKSQGGRTIDVPDSKSKSESESESESEQDDSHSDSDWRDTNQGKKKKKKAWSLKPPLSSFKALPPDSDPEKKGKKKPQKERTSAEKRRIEENRRLGRIKAAETRERKKDAERITLAMKAREARENKKLLKAQQEVEEKNKLEAARLFWSGSHTEVGQALHVMMMDERKLAFEYLLAQVELGEIPVPDPKVMDEVYLFPCPFNQREPWNVNHTLLFRTSTDGCRRAFPLFTQRMNRLFLAQVVDVVLGYDDSKHWPTQGQGNYATRAIAVLDLSHLLAEPQKKAIEAKPHAMYSWEAIVSWRSSTPLPYFWDLIEAMVQMVKAHLFLQRMASRDNTSLLPASASVGAIASAIASANASANASASAAAIVSPRTSDNNGCGVATAEKTDFVKEVPNAWRVRDGHSGAWRNMPCVLVALTMGYVTDVVLPQDLLVRLQRVVSHIKFTGGLLHLTDYEFHNVPPPDTVQPVDTVQPMHA